MKKALKIPLIESKRKHDLTIEELKKYPGLIRLSDEKATHILRGLKELSLLACYLLKSAKKSGNKLGTKMAVIPLENVILDHPKAA